jgi:fumarylacetoacetate (FAA) hydrolase
VKLGSLKKGGRDGTLVIVDRGLSAIVEVPDIAPTMQAALDDWATVEPRLREISVRLDAGSVLEARAFVPEDMHVPLPRAYQWADGSAYLNHVELVRRARGAEMPDSFLTDPLMYQGGSDSFIPPTDPIELADETWGIDMEGEVAVVTDDVPMGVSVNNAAGHIKLVMAVNDVSLRNLIPAELGKGFGFFQAKPSTSFAPVAVTPDELGAAWHGEKLHLPLMVSINGALFGKPDAGVDMNFSLGELIAHAAKSRSLGAGTIVGSGTVSNKLDGGPGRPVDQGGIGYSCIAEIRMIEQIESGEATTPFLKFGDRVTIEMCDEAGHSIFGKIDQAVQRYRPE